MRAPLTTLTRRALAAALLVFGGCSGEQLTNVEKDFTVGGLAAHGSELIRKGGAGKTLIQREGRLTDSGDGVRFVVELDTQGHVLGASLRREGRYGKRYVELRASAADATRFELMSRGNDEIVALPAGVIALTDLAGAEVGAPVGDAVRTTTVRVDLANAAFRVEGALAPAAPAATDPVLPAHTQRAPFVESNARIVVDWCKKQSAQPIAVDAAKEISAAIVPKLDLARGKGAPSAMNTVNDGAFDRGGAALLVACLRVLGHPARIVSGTVNSAARSWAQAHNGAAWVDVDPIALLPPPPPPLPDPTRALPPPGAQPRNGASPSAPAAVYVAQVEGLPSVFGPAP